MYFAIISLILIVPHSNRTDIYYLVMNRKTKIRGRRETDSECENSHPAWANNQYPADSLLKSSKEVKGKVKTSRLFISISHKNSNNISWLQFQWFTIMMENFYCFMFEMNEIYFELYSRTTKLLWTAVWDSHNKKVDTIFVGLFPNSYLAKNRQ